MKMRVLLAVMLVVCLLLGGCGGAATMESGAMAGGSAADKAAPEYMTSTSVDSGNGAEVQLPVNQKLIRKIWLDVETNDMDALLQNVEGKIAELGGYVESRQMQNGSIYASRRYRSGSLTVRIPAQVLDSFVSDVSGAANVVSNRETTEDVTLSYVENESRVTALETEQTRLLELLAKAETMEDILQIENRLTNIRSELEAVKGTLRVYDNQVNYGTVYLNIDEVTEYTEPEPDTMFKRMGTGIAKSWKSVVKGMENLLVFLVVALPYLLPIGAVAAVVIVICKHRKRKKQQNKQPPQAG